MTAGELISAIRFSTSGQIVSRMFSDKSLTKKAYLNVLASSLDYLARLVVGFVITPLLVAGLGSYFYGTWQILNRLVGYISPTSGRPNQALKWAIAGHQSSLDFEQKRRYVGSAIAVWMLFLPVVTVLGGILGWFAPYWLRTPVEFLWHVRVAAAFLVANLVITSIASIPQSVLIGENLGYKRMGLSAVLVFAGGGLTWFSLYLNLGIVGVSAAALTTTLLGGALFLHIAHNYVQWFGTVKPSSDEKRRFLGLSGWFVGWKLVMYLMLASDVVVLGLLDSVEAVTVYSLTKYAPETLVSIVATIAIGIAPGLGSIVGSGDTKKAALVRGEIMVLSWLLVSGLGSTVLIWNQAFIRLWVGPEYYAGLLPTLLVLVVVVQFVLIRNDSNFIDLTLRLRRKVVMGFLSVTLSIAAAAVLVGYFKLGLVGLCLGIILGRFVLSIGYPVLVGSFLGIKLAAQLKSALRPALATIALYLLLAKMAFESLMPWSVLTGWIGLFLAASATSSVVLLLLFYLGLTGVQRRNILRRILIIFPAISK